MWGLLFSIVVALLGVYEFNKLKKWAKVSKTTDAPYSGIGLWQGYVFGGTFIFLGVLGIINYILKIL